MKRYMFKLLIFFLFPVIVFLCDCCLEKDYPLYLENNTTFSTSWYLALGGEKGTEYPDTTLPQTDEYVIYDVLPKSTHIAGSGNKWEDVYSMLPKDTISVFVFITDTLNKYSWEEVRNGYKVLKRYDLSYDDLERMDWTITYP
ncbi:MAG: hypothetical protein V2B15_11370 [Bacteroidota bacterium]